MLSIVVASASVVASPPRCDAILRTLYGSGGAQQARMGKVTITSGRSLTRRRSHLFTASMNSAVPLGAAPPSLNAFAP